MEKLEELNQLNITDLPDFAQNLSQSLKKKYEAYHQIDVLKSPHSLDGIFSYVIPEYARDIIDLEIKKVHFVNIFRQFQTFIEMESQLSSYFTQEEVPESKIIFPVENKSLENFNIAAVDGSFVRKCYTNFEFALFRAISVIYSIKSENVDIKYYPEIDGFQNYRMSRIMDNVTEQVTNSQVSIDLALMEIRLVNDLLTKYPDKLDMIILDGSILAEPLNLLSYSSQNTELMTSYSYLVNEYRKLYDLCDLRKVDLVGIIKDTRSSTFRKLISRRIPQILAKLNNLKLTQIDYRKLLPHFSDLDLFHRILETGDRSCVFSINSAGTSWIPRQLEILKSEIKPHHTFLKEYLFYACYMKPVQYDFPIRIEIHQNRKNGKPEIIQSKIHRICENLYPLCSKFENFAIPIPQIEAHLRAKLTHNDLQIVINSLTRQISEEVKNYAKKMIFNHLDNEISRNFDEFLLSNNFLVPKRRERMPL
ncbi:MAG: DNA double-strand break repair nuclease NurA [Candidatus Lokiarchaeota archaeon]|nr:DNA double-strand break repair nuclease NurA [Candidatus Lokiarchaeota archaeon]